MTPKAALTRYVAFLRALNVGGHIVKMDRLRKCFEALRLTDVKTFIASGNVLFDSPERDTAALELRIAGYLEKQLGYEVATFVRSAAEVRRIAEATPFPASAGASGAGTSIYVGFFQKPLSPAARKSVLALGTADHEFHADPRELYWLCRISVLDSNVSWSKLEKMLGPATFRNANTVRRIAATL